MSKSFVFAALSAFVAVNAFADVRSGPLSLSSVKLERGQLSYSYVIGGGCEKHSPEVSLKLKAGSGGFLESAEVIVQDVASGPDYCEALISLKGTVDLFDLVKETARKTPSIKLGNRYTFKLPTVTVTE